MTKDDSKQDYFPLKPNDADGFKKPVSWFGGRELISSLKVMIIYSIYGGNIDPRPWMKANIYPPIEENPKNVEESVNLTWREKSVQIWEWKRKYFQVWDDYLKTHPPTGTNAPQEFWFDYIADSGDGQTGVYGVGCLCFSDLWIEKNEIGEDVKFMPPGQNEFNKTTLLPRGSFLFGGDTAYHVADYSTIHERFQNPFRWAFADVRKFLTVNYKLKADVYQLDSKGDVEKTTPVEFITGEKWDRWNGMLAEPDRNNLEKLKYWDSEPVRPLFGVPANHDYYDDIDGFNRQFRRLPFEDLEENRVDARYQGGNPLSIPTFQREQEASYTVLRLPFNWWLLGIDSENEKLDFRQRVFFKELMLNYDLKKVILATPEPTTVFGRLCDPEDKTATYLKDITGLIGLEQPFLHNGEFLPIQDDPNAPPQINKPKEVEGDYCRLDLSGDVHHYARYWGPDTSNFQKSEFSSDNYASLVAGGGGAFFDATETLIGKSKIIKNGQEVSVPGEIPPQKVFPNIKNSRGDIADRLFDVRNIKKAGYVQIAGAVIAIVIFYSLANVPEIKDFFKSIGNNSFSDDLKSAYPCVYLVLSIVFLITSRYFVHDLVTQLKDVRAKKFTKKNKDKSGKISELIPSLACFLVGIAVYLLLFFQLQFWHEPNIFKNLSMYSESLLLLLHFTIVGLIVWLSIEYSNWLTIRFKLFSDSQKPLDSWLNLFIEFPINQKIGDFLAKHNNFLSRLWQTYRTATVENVPIFILNGLAIAVFIFGIWFFGDHPLSAIGIDLLFTIIAFGGFFGLIAFAVFTGAAYQKFSGKCLFGVIGFWHAFLQILTPFILIYYSPWWFVLIVFATTVITNGVFVRGGANVMKRGSAAFLSFIWVTYGLLVIVPPFFLNKQVALSIMATNLIKHLTGFTDSQGVVAWLPLLLTLIIVGYLGHRMSRVWLGWYLAVSLAFNGHNNEAGGAARIEDFKHILRIKVEKTKLTVYVIGFAKAETDIKNLQPKLVDKFELVCKEFTIK
jgi:hypothetical protein